MVGMGHCNLVGEMKGPGPMVRGQGRKEADLQGPG